MEKIPNKQFIDYLRNEEFLENFIEDFYDRHKKRAVKTALLEFCFD